MIDSDQFGLIKDALLEEVEKQKASAKPKVKKKISVKSKAGIVSNSNKKSDSESDNKKSPAGLKVTLKKATLKKAPPVDTAALAAKLKKAEIPPVVVVEKTIEKPVEVQPAPSIVETPVVENIETPIVEQPVETPVAPVAPVAEPVEESAAATPESETVVEKEETPVVEPVVEKTKEEVVAPVAAPEKPKERVGVAASVQTNQVGLKEKELKVTIEKPTDEMLARIAKYKPKPKGPRKRNGDDKGYTGKLGAAPVKKEQKPRSGKDGTPTAVKQDSYAERLNKFADISAATAAPDKAAATAQGKKGKKKKGKDKKLTKAQKEERIEAVKGNVKSVMASLSKTPTKKTYKKEESEIDGDAEEKRMLEVSDFVTIGELAGLMEQMPAKVIGKCMEMGMMVTINYRIDFETIQLLADEFGFEAKLLEEYEEEIEIEEEVDESALEPRPPVVTVMGHVDHGKTSFLDYIRSQKVASGEAGGITQHIGAYTVETERGKVTFLDTPGHEAFSAMRARGSLVTDVIVLIVAADSRVMPQTVESIEHARAAKVPIVVAINKCDLPTANPDKIRAQLAERGIEVEEWGGKTACREVSAVTGKGIDELLEVLALETEIMELKANYSTPAKGAVVESSLDKGRGAVATILVQSGILRRGDCFVAGIYSGKVRAILDYNGKELEQADPSTPCQVLGFEGAPMSGDTFMVVENEKISREISTKRRQAAKERELRSRKHISLEQLYDRVKDGEFTELNVIVKADVDGSVEAIAASLDKLTNKEVKINIIRKAVGNINESDVMLAAASDAIIISFHLLPSRAVREEAEREGVQIKNYSIIYQIVEEFEGIVEGKLRPKVEEKLIGQAEVKQVFKVTKIGNIAGSMVHEGVVERDASLRIYRNGIELGTAEVNSLKRHQDDVNSVKAGYECGIGFKDFNDLREGDTMAFFKMIEIKRTLKDLERES
ncbi:MAG: translation initiation factor IF-2, partial [Fibrobacterales bacterium]